MMDNTNRTLWQLMALAYTHPAAACFWVIAAALLGPKATWLFAQVGWVVVGVHSLYILLRWTFSRPTEADVTNNKPND
jgi:hypothetical protein